MQDKLQHILTSVFIPILLILESAIPKLRAQTNVLTYHNDNARTGQNITETVLTPENVNSKLFGKIFSDNVDGQIWAQPLILTGVAIPGLGTHNVAYIVTENDSLYAFDAHTGAQLWRVNFQDASAGITTVPTSDFGVCNDVGPQVGITGTPVIDASSGTIYLVAATKENGSYFQRLHAIDVATHAEKFGGPIVIQASVPATGLSSTNGTLAFDPFLTNQRSGLLLQNGEAVITWGSHCDKSPYHGWLMAYNAATLAQEAAFSVTPNGAKGGTWMAGAGLAADSNFNIFVATGDGDYDSTTEWSDSILKLTGPSGNTYSVADWFTPYNQAVMQSKNEDLGSGGVLLLPTFPSGQELLVQAGKLATIYLVDRNDMGHYCSICTTDDSQIVQEISGAINGVWSMPAYWNGNVYFGAVGDYVKAFSFNADGNGLLSTTATSKSPEEISYPGTTPSVSANGSTAGILWVLDNSEWGWSCCQILRAYDATNLAAELYNSTQAANKRDSPGGAIKFGVPTIANGMVYVGSQSTFTGYGLLPSAAKPTFNPPAGNYTFAHGITISDTSPGVAIYYTNNGSTPTTSSTVYTKPVQVTTTGTTLKAIAAGGSFSPSAVGSATYILQDAKPTLSPAGGTYSSAQSVTISDSSLGVTICYTTNGTKPTASSKVYKGPIKVSRTTTIQAIATAPGFTASPVASATYTIR